MSAHAIGIDLGTSTSEIAYFEDGKPIAVPDPVSRTPIVPSYVAMGTDGELLVGEDAYSFEGAAEDRRVGEVKQKMGTGELYPLRNQKYRPQEISALILRHLKEMADRVLKEDIHDVVLSVPANFDDPAKAATRDAGELAGLRVMRLINEPTAAALTFGITNIDVEEQMVVFDFGGGTLDITAYEMVNGILDVHSSFGDPMLGGKNCDEALMALILRKFERSYRPVELTWREKEGLKRQAERAKWALSTRDSTDVHMRGIAPGVTLDVSVTREEFEREIAPLLDRARACVRSALNAKKIRPSAIDRVLLVGGTTSMPAVRTLVAEMFGREPAADVDPQLAVAQGACIQAAIIEGIIPPERGIILSDVASIGLGIEIMKLIGGQPQQVYDHLIEPNEKIPYSVTKSYCLINAEQDTVRVKVFQDRKGGARRLEDVEDIELEGVITDIPPSLTGQPRPIDVDFSYDISGEVKLIARIPETGQQIELNFPASERRLDPAGKEAARKRVDDLWEQNKKAIRYKALIDKAGKVRLEVPENVRDNIDYALKKLKDALREDDAEKIEAAGVELTDLLWELGEKDEQR